MAGKKAKAEKNNINHTLYYDDFKVFDTLLEGCQIIDSEWRYIYVNDAVVKHARKPREELLGKTMMEAFPGFDETELFFELQKVMKDRTTYFLENKFIYPDGSIGWFDLHVQPVPQGIIILSIDVTEKKNAADRTQNHLNQLITLRQIDMTINSNADLPLILGFILDQVMNTFEIDAAMILLFDPSTMMLEGKYHRGFHYNDTKLYQVRIGDQIAGKTAMERHTQAIPDVFSDPSFFPPAVPFEKEGFISYYSTPLISQGHILGVLEMYHRNKKVLGKELLSYFETIGGQTAVAIDKIRQTTDLHQTNLQLALAFDRALEVLPYLLELRGVDIPGHSQRVVDLTVQMATLLGYKNNELEHIRYGAMLHDVGLLTIPDHILLKPGKLDPEEWEQVKQHPNTAFNILSKNLALEKALIIPRYHHEKWDGSGYPFGLSAEQIPETARIFTVADVWDILRSDRPYRKKWDDKTALAYIKEQSGAHFDPQAVNAFLDILSVK